MRKNKVAIFPGHVGKDSGAIDGTVDDNLYTIEAVITGSIASKVYRYLSELGVSCEIYIGSFQKRLEDSAGSACGVSIHCDSFRDSHVSGAHLIHYTGSIQGEALSKIIYRNIDSFMDIRNTSDRNDLYILKKTLFPVVLIECGYITNPFDEFLLNTETHQNKIAMGISWSILNYINLI